MSATKDDCCFVGSLCQEKINECQRLKMTVVLQAVYVRRRLTNVSN